MSSIIIIDFFRFECLNSKQSMFRVKNVFNNGLILQALIIITRWVKLNKLIFNIVYRSVKYEFIDILN